MTAFKNAKQEIPENPARLRDCLNALAAACGHDVFRVEVTLTSQPKSKDTSVAVLVTCSKAQSEQEVAMLVVSELTRYLGLRKAEEAKPESEGATDVRS